MCYSEYGQSGKSKFVDDCPYNPKIDNFAEIVNVETACFLTLLDEFPSKTERSIGVLQLTNKYGGIVRPEDLQRLVFVRKLIGA